MEIRGRTEKEGSTPASDDLICFQNTDYTEQYKKKIEAIMFTTGRFMDLGEIAGLCNISSIGIVKEAINQLKEDYEKRKSSLQIFEENNKFKLNIRREFSYLTTKLLTQTEFDKASQETLALIAYKQPVLQSEIIKMRGNGAYDHIRLLREKEFLSSEKSGRTRLLKLTPKFYEYFDVVEELLKEQFKGAEEKQKEKEQKEKENTVVSQQNNSGQKEAILKQRVISKQVKKDKAKEREELEQLDKRLEELTQAKEEAQSENS